MSKEETISAWSLSRLNSFEDCAYKAKLLYIDRLPQLPLVAPEGKDEHPLDRGLRIHLAMEHFITKEQPIELIEELENLREPIEAARKAYQENSNNVLVEHKLAFDENWKFCGWREKQTWGRTIADLVIIEDDVMRIIDLKTGRKYPAKHIAQGQLYVATYHLKYPEISRFEVEFWYCDLSGEKLRASYKPVHAQMFREVFHERAKAMTTTTQFPPKPSKWNCRYCPYNNTETGTGDCEYAFEF